MTKEVPWYLTARSVVWGLVIFGPLALPLVWLSPKFALWQKVLISMTAVATTVLLVKFLGDAEGLLRQHWAELKELQSY